MAENQSNIIEEWRPVVGYEGVYSVSNTGRVRRDLPSRVHREGGNILKSHNCKGYPMVVLFHQKNRLSITVHKLVAAAFIGSRPLGYVINHMDGVKTNNSPDNLEYCTNDENMRHASRLGLMSSGERHGAFTRPNTPRGERNHKAKLNTQQVIEIREKHASGQFSIHRLSRDYAVSRPNIKAIITRETWAHI